MPARDIYCTNDVHGVRQKVFSSRAKKADSLYITEIRDNSLKVM